MSTFFWIKSSIHDVAGCIPPVAGEELVSTKMAFSNLRINVPIQQIPVLWEPSRLAQTRYDEHLGGGDGETSYQSNKQLPKISQKDMELHRRSLEKEVIATSTVGEEGYEGKEQENELLPRDI